MDRRTVLPAGTRLSFPGMECEIEYLVGKGSNAIVYKGKYYDGLLDGLCHHVLIKEMFPYHQGGLVCRDDNGNISVLPGGEDTFELHKYSFECGNEVHLRLLEHFPDRIGANINSFCYGGTLYTVMGYDGGRALESECAKGAKTLRDVAHVLLDVLDATEVFHSSGYLHLDISPDNILRVGEGKHARTYLIDYNSVHSINTIREGRALYCSAKEGYTSPEVRSGAVSSIGCHSDIYSISAVFYWLLMGKAPSAYQLMCKNPPDAHDSPLLDGAPETVSAAVRKILKRGLAGMCSRRYATVEDMRADVLELIDRIDGIGITHSSLWEAGKRNISALVKENPAMHYICDEATLYPMRLAQNDGSLTTVRDAISGCLDSGESIVLRAPGGMGKTTALLHTALTLGKKYSPQRPAFLYISLYDYSDSGNTYVRNRILEDLRFGREIGRLEDARHRLNQVLDTPITTKNGQIPAYVLLIDGINEAAGDTEPLKRELTELSKLKGTVICCTTRGDAAGLDIPTFDMAQLTHTDICDALAAKGLLMPDGEEMRELLRAPLMLSIFIRTAGNTGKQIPYSTSDELIDAYFDSLCEKETEGLSENEPKKWLADAALRFVLPAICGEIVRKKRSLDGPEMMSVVERCYKVFSSRGTLRLFPRWIGHSKDIRGETRHSEEWYGIVVGQLLRYRMGMLVCDSSGGYRGVHQLIEEYLVKIDAENRRKLIKRRAARWMLSACCVIVVAVSSVILWNAFVRPQPYDEYYAHSVMEGAVTAQMNLSGEIETMISLLSANDSNYTIYRSNLSARLAQHITLSEAGLITSPEWAEEALSRMMETGKVMPWSYDRMNEIAYTELFEYGKSCAYEYAYYLEVLDFLVANKTYNDRYGDDFREKLTALALADAQVADTLYKLVIDPHLSAMEKADSQNYVYYIEALGGLSDISGSEPEKCTTADLEAAIARRRDKLVELASSEVLTIYDRMRGNE
ncbi:MAG: hypothetical protein E7628_07470 [Ruminococcaceae bacterium]|nr:hypothetical protein [Oscillospiraceae bacterium]